MKNICCAILSFVGAMFLLKYGGRYVSYSVASALSLAYFILLFFYTKTINKWNVSENISQKLNIYIIAILVAVIIVFNIKINPYALNVDRWSALENTIDAMLAGQYPYDVETHLGNHCSTMPLWMFVHTPFRLIGFVGLSLIAGILAYFVIIWIYYGSIVVTKTLLLLILCPSFWYEILTISDLQTNFFMLAAFVCFITTSKTNDSLSYAYLIAFMAGLFLSTRLTVAFPLFFAITPIWRNVKRREKVLLPLVSIVTYVATLIPFIYWNGDISHFTASNPFQIQTLQSDIPSIVFVCILSMGFIRVALKSRQKTYAVSAITLFSFILAVFVSQYVGSGCTDDLTSYHYDITYLAQSLPFTLLAINTEKVCQNNG